MLYYTTLFVFKVNYESLKKLLLTILSGYLEVAVFGVFREQVMYVF